MNMLGKAIEIAATAHAGQTDKSGRPYILHPLWVMNQVRHLGDDYMVVAVLHDVIEDTHVTIDFLHDEGFSEYILHSLEQLDFRKKDYNMQIRKIAAIAAEYPIPRAVKMKDIEHNSQVTRLKGLREKDFDRLKKYNFAYTHLKHSY